MILTLNIIDANANVAIFEKKSGKQIALKKSCEPTVSFILNVKSTIDIILNVRRRGYIPYTHELTLTTEDYNLNVVMIFDKYYYSGLIESIINS